jgi:phosphatidylglycerol:prolipoprotein diacylglycerol transferase
MLPVIDLGIIKISSYTLMLILGLIGYIVCTLLIVERVEKTERKAVDRLLVISIVGFIALAVFAFIFNSIFHSIEEGKIVIGGITWLGGVVAAFPLTIYLIHKYGYKAKGNALYLFNLLIPGIVLAHGFGRIGCFLGGCCFGQITDSVFGVKFPEGSLAALTYPSLDGDSLAVLPTQLFEAIFEFVLFAVMLIFYKKLKKQYLSLYCISYGVFRFILEFFRGDDRGATGFFLSPSQFLSIILLVAGILIILYQKNIVFKKLYEKVQLAKELQLKEEPIDVKNSTNITTLLKELKSLRDEEIISEEEFEEKKKELLERL